MFSLSLAPRLARQSCYDLVRLLDRTSAHRLEGKGGEDPSWCTIYIVKVQRSAQGLKIGDPKTAKGNRFKIFGISNAVDLRQFLAVPMAVPCTKYFVLCTIEGIISDQPCKVFVISFPCILRTSKSKPRVWYIFEFPVHRTSAHALATSRRQCFYSPKNENACKRIIAQWTLLTGPKSTAWKRSTQQSLHDEKPSAPAGSYYFSHSTMHSVHTGDLVHAR